MKGGDQFLSHSNTGLAQQAQPAVIVTATIYHHDFTQPMTITVPCQGKSITFGQQAHRGACSAETRPGQWRRGRGCSPSRHRAPHRPQGT
jgi:hypothetical protein